MQDYIVRNGSKIKKMIYMKNISKEMCFLCINRFIEKDNIDLRMQQSFDCKKVVSDYSNEHGWVQWCVKMVKRERLAREESWWQKIELAKVDDVLKRMEYQRKIV